MNAFRTEHATPDLNFPHLDKPLLEGDSKGIREFPPERTGGHAEALGQVLRPITRRAGMLRKTSQVATDGTPAPRPADPGWHGNDLEIQSRWHNPPSKRRGGGRQLNLLDLPGLSKHAGRLPVPHQGLRPPVEILAPQTNILIETRCGKTSPATTCPPASRRDTEGLH